MQSSIMSNKNSNKESEKAILSGIKEEMAKPRIAKSARAAEPKERPVSALNRIAGPGLARPSRRPRGPETHPGAS
jgi:hypothetical protein